MNAHEILTRIAQLPVEQQADAILDLIAAVLEHLPEAEIEEIRGEITRQFAQEEPIVTAALELIEGHCALRAMRGTPSPS